MPGHISPLRFCGLSFYLALSSQPSRKLTEEFACAYAPRLMIIAAPVIITKFTLHCRLKILGPLFLGACSLISITFTAPAPTSIYKYTYIALVPGPRVCICERERACRRINTCTRRKYIRAVCPPHTPRYFTPCKHTKPNNNGSSQQCGGSPSL